MPLCKGKIVLVLFQYYSDIRDFSILCGVMLLIGPSLIVLGTACFPGTAQIPLPLSKWTVCTKCRRHKLQQLATVTEQRINYSCRAFQSIAPSLGQVLSSGSFE